MGIQLYACEALHWFLKIKLDLAMFKIDKTQQLWSMVHPTSKAIMQFMGIQWRLHSIYAIHIKIFSICNNQNKYVMHFLQICMYNQTVKDDGKV